MTADLESRIKRHIAMNGPLPLAEYMHWCLFDAKAGYYTTRDAIGRGGDFITAPEISQMFGEMIGIWLFRTWQGLGSPASFDLIEIGPGRGTLMLDMLRATGKLPGFVEAAKIHLVEASPALVATQQKTLAQHGNISWINTLEEYNSQDPCLVIANELLDALPARQYIKSGDLWHERCVSLDQDDELSWVLGTGTIASDLLPSGHESEPDGAVFETSAPREAYVHNICELLRANGGAALMIDYGHAEPGFGDTFQAIRGHQYAEPLDQPGQSDLSSHVDFGSLRRIAQDFGLHCPEILTQGEFLLGAGLLERAGQLGSGKDEAMHKSLTAQAERLALPAQMGNLFKVMAISSGPDLWLFDHKQQA